MKQIWIGTVGVAALGLGAVAQVTETLPKPSVQVTVEGGYRTIVSNGIPDHATGAFPNRGNPNRIAQQQHRFRVPMVPQPASQPARGILFGVAVNGIPFDPGTAELWNNNFAWHYEALSGAFGRNNRLGVDRNLAHVQPDGTYHYHGIPTGLLEKLGADKRMVQIGWAADGYPIYGNLGPSDPKDLTSALRTLRSSYRLKTGNRPAGDSPQGVYDGSFSQDFEYVAGSGDLDANNGRSGPTPEFPNGTYYYVLTETFPFVPRTLRGTPDASFRKGGPGAGGPRVRQEAAPTATATNGRHWFVVRDGILYQFDVVTGNLVGKTNLPSPENR